VIPAPPALAHTARQCRRAAKLLLSAGCALVAGCSSPQQETHYKTLTAAQSAGAVHEGWISAWLPGDAYNLKEKHDAATSRSIVRFNFPASEKWAPPSNCSPAPPSQVPAPSIAAAWWPSDLPAPADVAPQHSYYTCAGASGFLAVDYPRGEGFYWQVRR
jgi:hypothetical protein